MQEFANITLINQVLKKLTEHEDTTSELKPSPNTNPTIATTDPTM